jgi:hypothetical protein
MKYAIILTVLLFLAACTTQTPDTGSSEPINTPPLDEITEGDDEIGEEVMLASCEDSDTGLDYRTAGIVTYEGEEYADECFQEDRLREYYCEEGIVKIDLEHCQDGVCEDGACVIKPQDKFGCVDTDNGINLEVAGVATDARGKQEADRCEYGQIFEAYCDNFGVVEFKTFKCDVCEAGVCVQQDVDDEEFNCVDTDGGIIFDVAGNVTDAYGRVGVDECLYESRLTEYYCDSFGFLDSRVETCNCYQGRCTD